MRRKLEKFRENEIRENVIQPGKPLFEVIKGQWYPKYFKAKQPLVLELGCGRGEYTLGMAHLYPDRNYVGVDMKGDRIWKGSKTAEKDGLHQVAFLRTQVQSITEFFAPQEADEIWITFPDPRPKKRDIKRRMVHPRFLELYKTILNPTGWVHLKTDNDILFEYALEVLQQRSDITNLEYITDVYSEAQDDPLLTITTHYEQLFASQGFNIKYLKFQFLH